ncbi:MAG TPA: hypothetical protein VFY87_18010, partial [Geminicoccaceae bacterium]|nr:hypothetical protein [Geminicoccaceae bacterium]
MRGKQGTAQGYDFDLVLAGDFRARGEVAETLASHLATLTGCGGPAPGLLWLRDPGLAASATVHGRIAALARRHALAPIEPDADPVRCRLLLVYEPRLLAGPRSALPRVHADVALVVLAQPLLRRGGGPAFDVAAAAGAIAGGLARRQLWCPAGPQIRAQCGEHTAGLPLDPDDLRPCEPLGEWRTGRVHRSGGRPILGRIVRYDDDRLPGSGEKVLQAYPADKDLEVRFLDGEAALSELVKPTPANWRLFAAEAMGTKRFLARLDAYVQYQDEPARLFLRAALQAMAAGRVVVLPPTFRSTLGDGPVYRDAEQVADTVRYLQAEPRFYARYVAEQDAALAERFAPQCLLDRVGEFVSLPKPPRPAPRREGKPPRRAVAFYPTNGVGLGHVTRALAIARRLAPEHEPVFFTPCHALALIEHAGFRTEYVPEPLYDETAPA